MNEKVSESLFVAMHFEGKRLVCGTRYRPPGNDNLGLRSFFDSINLVKGNLNKTKSKCFLIGDLNFNLLDLSDEKTEQFINTMFNYDFYPLINKPIELLTRVCPPLIIFGPMSQTGSRTKLEPEFYKPVLRYFCRTITEPESHFPKSRRANLN